MSTAENRHAGNYRPNPAVLSPVLAWTRIATPASLVICLLLGAVFASAVSVVYATHRNRVVFHELQQLRNEQNELDVLYGQLLIEQSTFGQDGRIERRAAEELDMKVPEWSETVVVEYE